jgi:hypothetical protein
VDVRSKRPFVNECKTGISRFGREIPLGFLALTAITENSQEFVRTYYITSVPTRRENTWVVCIIGILCTYETATD